MNVFQITIQRKLGDSWPVVVERSRADELPLRAESELDLGAGWREQLRTLALDPIAYGTVLGKALFRKAVRDAFVTARNKSGDDLRTLLVVEDDELKPLHWERLCAPIRSGGKWGLLGTDQRSIYSLYLPSLADRRFPAIGRRDLRALVLVANPPEGNRYGLDRIDESATVAGIRAALGDLPHDLLASESGAVGRPTLDELVSRITGGSYTLLHIVAHGWYDDSSGETTLYLLDDSGQVSPVAASRLTERLEGVEGNLGLPRLTFLATCESAAPEGERAGALGGLAQRLVRDLGLPAVVAMTQKVSVATATALAREFYVRLRSHGEADRALVQANAGLAERGDITVPALYSRLAGRPLFNDTPERELTNSEVEFGLTRFEALLPERAPTKQEEFSKQAGQLRGVLGADRENLSEAARAEWHKALAAVNAMSEEVLDLYFPALALGQEPLRYDRRCPFPGLLAFGSRFASSGKPEDDDRNFFFGREGLIKELVVKLEAHPFLAVVGGSGSGKSSLVLAGLLPALEKAYPGLRTTCMTPGNDPLARLDSALGTGSFNKQSEWRDGGSLPVAGKAPTILVVDQFEELFRLTQDDKKRWAFVMRLLGLTKHCFVVLTMRADFWGDCAPYAALRDAMLAHQVLIAPMTSAELRSAMEQQSASVGLRFEADLSNTIIDDVRGEPGAMPLLQHALLELWKRRHGRWLLSIEYREKIGGIRQAIARTADEIYENSSKEDQERIRNIFIRLTRLGDEAGTDSEQRDTRRRCLMRELVAEGDNLEAVRNLVHRLGSDNARLVVIKEKELSVGPQAAEVDIAHETLIRHWPKLRQWLNEDRVNLRLRDTISEDAKEWENSGRDDNLLPRWNSKLEAALEIRRKKPDFFNEHENNYLNACVNLRERETLEREQRENNLRSALAEAQRQGRIATARQLVVQSQATLENYPQRSLLLAAESLLTTRRANEPRVPIAEEVLRQALAKTGGIGLSGHEGPVTAVSISANNRWLVTGSGDKTARLWDLSTLDPARTAIVLRGHEGWITAVAISADNRWLVTGSGDKTARLWDLSTLDPARTAIVLRGHEGWITAVTINADNRWLVTAGGDKTARLWYLNAEDPDGTDIVLRGHEDWITAVAISPDNRWLVTGSRDKTARLWDLSTPDPARTAIVLRGHEDWIAAVSISANNRWLVTGSRDKTARLWDLSNPDPARTPVVLRGHEGWITAVTISPDNRWLVTGSGDKTARLWDLSTPEPARTTIVLRGHEGRITAVTISADHRCLVTGSGDKTARLWDLSAPNPGSKSIVLQGHEGWINAVAISADNRWLVTGSEDKTARLWDLSAPNPARTAIVLPGHEDSINAVAISADNRWLATGSDDKTARLWDLSAPDPACTAIVLPGHEDSISAVALSADNRWVVTGSDDKTARLWDLSASDPACTAIVLRGHEGWISAVSISADNRWVAIGSDDKTARLWNLSAADPARTAIVLRGHKGWISDVAISANNRWLVTGGGDKTARLWDLSAPDPASTAIVLSGHESWISVVAISADNRWIVTAGGDKTVRLWDLSAPDPASTAIVLRGHENDISAVAISANNRWLMTGSDDKAARLWDLSAPDPTSTAIVLRGHEDWITAVAISADNRWLVTGSRDKTARLWDLRLDELVSLSCRTAGRNLTREEWAQYVGNLPYQKTCPNLP
jgi:WD40 repeat protein